MDYPSSLVKPSINQRWNSWFCMDGTFPNTMRDPSGRQFQVSPGNYFQTQYYSSIALWNLPNYLCLNSKRKSSGNLNLKPNSRFEANARSLSFSLSIFLKTLFMYKGEESETQSGSSPQKFNLAFVSVFAIAVVLFNKCFPTLPFVFLLTLFFFSGSIWTFSGGPIRLVTIPGVVWRKIHWSRNKVSDFPLDLTGTPLYTNT